MTIAPLTRAWKLAQANLTNAWLVMGFFVTLYLIVLLKVVTYETVYDDVIFGGYSLLITTYILSRFLLAYFHKQVRVDRSYEPSVSFVVPAKNEGDNIAETLHRFGQVDYPKEKIEVIAINDGSTDHTLSEMRRAAAEIAPRVGSAVVIDWPVNRGKRAGMAEGTKLAKNEIVIFVDSDSFIQRDAVRHLVKYFADPAVGGVSGHTDVENINTNLLTQMQAARYYIAFSVYKAAESAFGLVTCLPGCQSAYRRSYVLEFIDAWLEQKFLGAECTFGDDRSLTNFMIRKYRTVYSAEALATTVVPDTFATYLKQQQRWKKSWARETWIAATFVWRKNPLASFSFYVYTILAFASPIVFVRAVVWLPVTESVLPSVYLIGLFLMLFLQGIYYRIRVGPRPWLLAIAASWFYSLILMWQLPWAIITIRDSRWGTR